MGVLMGTLYGAITGIIFGTAFAVLAWFALAAIFPLEENCEQICGSYDLQEDYNDSSLERYLGRR